MKRIHIHVNVEENKFDSSVGFYQTLFNASPSVTREGYAKFFLDDPAVNFVIEVLEVPGDIPGIHHVGIQVDEDNELSTILASLKEAETPLLEIGRTQCCFSNNG